MHFQPCPPVDIPAVTRDWLRQHQVPLLLAAPLVRRGIHQPEDLSRLFFGRLSDATSCLCFGPPLAVAVERLRKAMVQGQRILVFADYDCDGTTGAALILGILRKLQPHYGFSLELMIPDRFTEGYGLNRHNLTRLLALRPDLVITVDCGISSHEEVSRLKQCGIDCIVTDHHEPKGDLPLAAAAILHPRHCGYPFDGLSGCGVAYQLMKALWTCQGKEVPDWVDHLSLDLVAIGAICDIMPLVGDNRLYVREGLKLIDEGKRMAFRLMKEHLRWKRLTSEVIAYQIGPRINAAGRMSSAEVVVQWLLSEEKEECQRILRRLEEHNQQRRVEQERVLKEGWAQVASGSYRHLAVVQGEYHEGVVGIAASKFAQSLYRPAFVLSADEKRLKGSARSIHGIHLFELIQRHAQWLDSWGGHAMAAGLTLRPENADSFFRSLDEELAGLPQETWQRVDHWEVAGEENDLTPDLFRSLAALEPFGEKFPPVTWRLEGQFSGKSLSPEKKVGRLRIGQQEFPFAMWDHADQVEPGRKQVYYGCWEWSDYWQGWQFNARWSEM